MEDRKDSENDRQPAQPKPPGGTTEKGGHHVKKQGRTTETSGPRGQQDGRPERRGPK